MTVQRKRTALNLPSNRRLILVSNREPYIHKKTPHGIECEKAIGGLVSALDPAMQVCGGSWVAWGSGDGDKEVSDSKGRVKVPDEDPSYTLRRVWLSEREVSRYYYGFSNRILWPISHNFLEKANLKQEYWKSYCKVNEKFSNAVIEEAKKKDMIWVHDYHLSLVPDILREANEDSTIAFFWHIPWPSWEVFRTLPWREEILKGLLGCNLIGFHVQSYVKNFVNCACNVFDISYDGEKRTIDFDGREITVKAFPIGVDYRQIASLSASKTVTKKAYNIRKKLRAKYLIFGMDRLDYTKGILERLKAMERLFEKYRKFRGKVVFVQTASPSRTKVKEYRNMKREIEETVGRINGRFQKEDWAPIRYFYRVIPEKQLIAYYRASDIALITPLIDGMNLIAKEYVATKEEGDGVLILSEFVGAAEELKEALLVNPYDVDSVAEAIKNGLEMPARERRQRLDALKGKVKSYDVYWWLQEFSQEFGRIAK